MTKEEVGFEIPSAERPWLLSRLVRMNRYLILLLLIPAGVIYFWPNWGEQEKARQELEKSTRNRDTLAALKTKRKNTLELLKTDPEFLEIMARDKLGLQKEGEIILHFDE